MVAIPCNPLGPGRSRPLVPWRSPSAPAHLPYSPSTTASSTSSSASNLTPSSEHFWDRNSVVNSDGKWIKFVGSGRNSPLQHNNSHSTSGRLWSILSKRFRKEYKLMYANGDSFAYLCTLLKIVSSCAAFLQEFEESSN